MNIFNKNNYHFIGIGGIGISAIARMLQMQGKNVSGSDSAQSEITDDLANLGINVAIGQRAENIPAETEVVIYTVAIRDDNPELAEAQRRGLICVSYPQTLGELSKNMFTIAISGTHGKTTTTAMIGHILQKAGLDPTIIVGSMMLSDGEKSSGNFLAGQSKYLVVEACEYKRSFLNLTPQILVITNIETDHLDYYKNIDDIRSAFGELEAKVPKDGFVIKNSDYTQVKTDFDLLIPGRHNILNAQAAIKAVESLGISNKKAKKYLSDFKGTWRRLEYKGEKKIQENTAIFYDDYAHHPSEIAASLSALREKYPDRKLVCVFEPHQQSRTKLLFTDFIKALSLADQVFIAPIYMAREIPDPTISNKILADAVNKNVPTLPVQNVGELKNKLQNISPPSVPLTPLTLRGGPNTGLCIVLMGAGDIYRWTPSLLT